MRIDRFQQKVRENRPNGAVISNADNLFYLSEHLIREGVGPSILVPVSDESVLVVNEDDIYLPSCKNFPGRLLAFPITEIQNTVAAVEAQARSYAEALKPPLGIEADFLPLRDAEILGIDSD